MANTLVPSAKMLNPDRLDMTNKWHQLNTNDWSKNVNLIGELEQLTRHGHYYAHQKSFKKLWDLLTYCDSEDAAYIIRYFDLPEDTVKFIRWTYNEVGVEDSSWKWEVERKEWHESWEDLLPQDDWFPYEYLYPIYKSLA